MSEKNDYLITRATERMHTSIGWLDSYHSFSFGGHHDAQRMGFGPLRVFNDDTVIGGAGFPSHPHRDMEIISIVLEGALMHKDSLGNGRTIKTGDIQYMSAGSGVVHSEMNASESETVKFIQLWIEPKEIGLEPIYADRSLLTPEVGQWVTIVSSDGRDDSMQIRQDALIYSIRMQSGAEAEKRIGRSKKTWVFVLEGTVELKEPSVTLGARDSVAIDNAEAVVLKNIGSVEAQILLFEL